MKELQILKGNYESIYIIYRNKTQYRKPGFMNRVRPSFVETILLLKKYFMLSLFSDFLN